MLTQNFSLLNTRVFVVAISTLLAGYVIMALIGAPFFRFTIAPVLILAAFVLFVLSLVISSKK